MVSRRARSYAIGDAVGAALVLSQPLSFWGGIDVETGRIIDHSHPDLGRSVTAAILVMPAGRGSSSSSSVFAESIRRGTGPAAIVLATSDPILTVGALVAHSLYGVSCPVVVCSIEGMATGDHLQVVASGDGEALVTVAPKSQRP
ncbi:MAG: DUF126 domain-containing protein [Acidobacteria bacterium]|nr:DUF126 domain-containing protein [Acidobacteriota bacterium]